MTRWLAMMVLLFMAVTGGIPAVPARAATTLDAAFKPVLATAGTVKGIAPLASGKVMLFGDFTSISGVATRRIARLNADGSVDTGFQMTPEIRVDRIDALAVQADGKILIGGYLTYNGADASRNYLFRLNANGTLDTTFDAGGYNYLTSTPYGLDGPVTAILVQPDGKIAVGGEFGAPTARIARLNADGSRDTSFTPGSGASGTVTHIARQSTGKLIIGGAFATVNGTAKGGIARLNSNGTLDAATFGSGLYGGSLAALAVQADDKILLGGTFGMLNGTEVPKLVRLNNDGTPDASFTQLVPGISGGSYPAAGYFQAITGILPTSNGIIVGGWYSQIIFNGNPTDHAARIFVLNAADGAFVNSVSFKGKPTDLWGLARRSDGTVLAGGSFTQLDDGTDASYRGLCLLTGSYYQPDSAFRPVVGGQADVATIAVQSDGKVLAGGNLALAGNQPRNGVARLTAAGALDATLTPPATSGDTVRGVLLRSDGKLVVGGSFYQIADQSYRDIVLLNSAGGVDTYGDYVGGINGLAWYPGGKVLVAMPHSPGVRRLNANLTIEAASTFNPGDGISNAIQADYELDRVNAVAVQDDGRILVGGSFSTFSGVSRQNVVRLNADGSLDSTFSSPLFTVFNFRSEVFAIAVQADGKILLAGRFSTVGGVPSPSLVRLNPDGSVDTGFSSPFGDSGLTAHAVAVQPDGRILVGGNIQLMNGDNIYNGLVRLERSGARDATFSSSVTGIVKSLLVTRASSGSGQLLAGGTIEAVDGSPRFGLARYLIDALPALLTVEKRGSGAGSVTASSGSLGWVGASGTALYAGEPLVTLTATPSAGSTFGGWSGEGCSGAGTCSVTMTRARYVEATFSATSYPVTVSLAGSGGGSVNSIPSGIACTGGPTGCSAQFTAGSQVTLAAIPDDTSLFGGWSGACSGPTCALTLNAPVGVTATFAVMPPVRIMGTAPAYSDLLQSAFGTITSNGEIQARSVLLTENATFGKSLTVSLQGGYDAGYKTQTGFTTIEGSLTIGAGSLAINRVAIR